MKSKLLLSVAFLLCLLLTIAASGIPLFWDAVYYALPALKAGSSFTPLHIPESFDTGGFPFYSTLLFFSWSIFGSSLFAVHIALLPFLLGGVYAFYRIGKLFLTEKMIPWTLLLLFMEPCFLTQSLLAAPDIILLSFFLLALMSLLEKRRMLFTLFLILLVFCNMRGLPAAGALFVLDFILTPPSLRFKKNLLAYLPVIVLTSVWFTGHYFAAGWFFSSPLREKTDEHTVGLFSMGKHIILIIWKLVDSGRIILWLFLAWALIYFRRSPGRDPVFNKLLLLFLLPLLFLSLLLIPLSNPAGARYFMPVFVLLILPVCYLLQQWKTIYRILSVVLISGILISGNWWIYPERLSNEWDTSLKVLPFFGLDQQMHNYILTQSIPVKDIATQFPLIYSPAETFLTTSAASHDAYTNALAGPVSKFPYYLHSNVCNTDLLPQIEEIKKKWKLVKEFRKGEVYISLYENPGSNFP